MQFHDADRSRSLLKSKQVNLKNILALMLSRLSRPLTDRSAQAKDSSTFLGKMEGLIRRRHHRVTLSALHSVVFEIEPEKAPVELANISISGMGLLTRSLPRALQSGEMIEGVLFCGDSKLKVSAEVMHSAGQLAGCQFAGHDRAVNKLVQSYLNLELNALTMISVNPSMLQEDPDGTPHWIHGKNNCEVFFVAQGDRIKRFNLTFFGNYIEGGEGLKPKYGQVVEEDDSLGKPRHKGAALIRWDTRLASEMETYALRFLNGVPHLTDQHRLGLIQLLGVK